MYSPSVDTFTPLRCAFGRVPDRRANVAPTQAYVEISDGFDEENLDLRDQVVWTPIFEHIVGSSEAICSVTAQVMRVAPSDATVLITGGSGTGKELIARAIHRRSRRARSPFTRMNCAATPASLIAAELFGYERGAFTGATQRRAGRFEVANYGTIFLDEIGDVLAENPGRVISRASRTRVRTCRRHSEHPRRRARHRSHKLRSAGCRAFRNISSRSLLSFERLPARPTSTRAS
jgi:transcriptional regulator with AAA-type ATPase domain